MDGLTVISAFPHAHLQGRSIWTKIIRNGTAVDYLFNGEEFNFNYQFSNRLVTPIKLYPVVFLSKIQTLFLYYQSYVLRVMNLLRVVFTVQQIKTPRHW